MELRLLRLGRMDYAEALAIQEKLLDARQADRLPDTLVLVEHPPVITLGRRGKQENILASKEELNDQGVKVYNVGRGGDVTYHGPGQIVGYPIIDLKKHGKDIRKFIWNVEKVFIRLLYEQFGIKAHREDGTYTGVWVGQKKVTAIGVAVKRWVTMHGFAFNVNTNLEHFKWINNCGLSDRSVTSVERLVGAKQDFEHVACLVARYYYSVFGYESVREAEDYETKA